MSSGHRARLLRILARIERQFAEAEALTIEAPDYEILLRASALLTEHRSMLADVERKLRSDDQE